MPSGLADGAAPGRGARASRRRSRGRSSSGAPESSNWPPGSSDMVPPASPSRPLQGDDVVALHDRLPAEAVRSGLPAARECRAGPHRERAAACRCGRRTSRARCRCASARVGFAPAAIQAIEVVARAHGRGRRAVLAGGHRGYLSRSLRRRRSPPWHGGGLLLVYKPRPRTSHARSASQRQSPSTAFTRARAATAAVSARRMRGPSEMRVTNGWRQQRRARPRRSRPRVRSARPADPAAGGQRRDRVGAAALPRRRRRACASASQAASTRSSFRGSPTSGMRRMPHCSAASMALARMRSRLTRSRPVWLRQHRRQPRQRPSRSPSAPCSRGGHASAAQTDSRCRGRAAAAAPASRSAARRRACPRRRSRARHSPSRPLKTRSASPSLQPQHVSEIVGLLAEQATTAPAQSAVDDRDAGVEVVAVGHVPVIARADRGLQRAERIPLVPGRIAAAVTR